MELLISSLASVFYLTKQNKKAEADKLLCGLKKKHGKKEVEELLKIVLNSENMKKNIKEKMAQYKGDAPTPQIYEKIFIDELKTLLEKNKNGEMATQQRKEKATPEAPENVVDNDEVIMMPYTEENKMENSALKVFPCKTLRFSVGDALGYAAQDCLKHYNKTMPEKQKTRDDVLKDLLLKVDNIRAGLGEYHNILDDKEEGHWDIFRNRKNESDDTIIYLDKRMYARNPIYNIKDGLIAIDFGTSSTVVAKLENNQKELLRIGKEMAQLQIEAQKDDFENPTIMRFKNIERFKKVYNNKDGRPTTSWADLYISHKAKDDISRGRWERSNDFCNYFTDLKQWANAAGGTTSIEDAQGYHESLKALNECQAGDLNPIEYYAYNLGNNINNMRNGIYLKYVLSYPTKYDSDVREAIRASFERGLRKSLPQALLDNKDAMKEFKVKMVASEPAAYAITALQEFGFTKDKIKDRPIHYAVFDFGGGTTDFDFGIWKAADKGSYHHYEIHHFGEDGDEFLGGENILKLLAFDVFKKNLNELKDIYFTQPPRERDDFEGCDIKLSKSSHAQLNTRLLSEKLRVFTELTDYFMDIECDVPDKYDQNELAEIKGGTLRVRLFDKDGKGKEVMLAINPSDIIKTIKDRIFLGIDKFLNAMKGASDKLSGCEELNIFLAGNASLSPIVKRLFEEEIQKLEADIRKRGGDFTVTLWQPLGSKEVKNQQKEESKREFAKMPTGKSGVAFGLLEARDGGYIKIISEHSATSKLPLQYYVGKNRHNDFIVLLKKGDGLNGTPKMLLKDAVKNFELLYTLDIRASTNKLKVGEANAEIRTASCSFVDVGYSGEYVGHSVFVRATGPKQVECLLLKDKEYREDAIKARLSINLN